MSIFLLVNNSSTVSDVTPATVFVDKEQAFRALYKYEMASVFKPIVLYEYILTDGFAKYPSFFHRVKRNWKSIVEGIETMPVNHEEYKKNHPFVFDKLESVCETSPDFKKRHDPTS